MRGLKTLSLHSNWRRCAWRYLHVIGANV